MPDVGPALVNTEFKGAYLLYATDFPGHLAKLAEPFSELCFQMHKLKYDGLQIKPISLKTPNYL